MPFLILVKHSLPQIDTGVPARHWELGQEGIQRCEALAEHLRPYLPAKMSASQEPKASATARHVGAILGLPVQLLPGLEEHHRERVPFLSTPAFQQRLAGFFAAPAERVLGEESADEAHRRFAGAINQLLAAAPEQNQIVVTHETVISLFVARHTGEDPYALWERLDLPSFVVFEAPAYRCVEVAQSVARSQ
jgi:broad specificity phosphatase PhoE